MNIKRIVLWFTMLMSAVLFCTVGIAAEDRTFHFSLQADGKTEVSASVGDIITVVFTLENTEDDTPYTIYAMQNEVRYDSTFFELIEDSIVTREGIVYHDISVGGSERELYMNFLSLSGGADWDPETIVGSFQLRVIGTSGAGRISNEDCSVSLPDGSGSYACERTNLIVVVSDTCTICFDSKGGSTVASQTVQRGTPLQVPTTPVRAGYRFTGWYTDRDCTQLWSVEMPVTYNLCLYAGWEKDDSVPRTLPFIDVLSDDWFYDSVRYVYFNGLMNGISDTRFAPDTETSRAMAVTILWRMEGSPVVQSEMRFEDVIADQWYTEAVRWASSEGIVNGYSDTVFGVNDRITREQMAAILCRYAAYKGYDVSAETDITVFGDAQTVSDWAVDAMKWSVENGLIQGVGNATLHPLGSATRVQTAAILMRFCIWS